MWKKRKVLLVVLLVLLLESLLCSGYAETDSITALPTNRLSASISLSGNNLTGKGKATFASGYSANLSIYVQHKNANGSWSTVASASEPNAIAIYITHTVSNGEYRIKVEAAIYDSGHMYIETLTKYSSVISI